jgi:hypothetical protein
MNHRGRYAPIGRRASRGGAKRSAICAKCGPEARVCGKENVSICGLNAKPTPQCSIAIEGSARGEVLRRNEMDTDFTEALLLPAVELYDGTEAEAPDPSATSVRRADVIVFDAGSAVLLSLTNCNVPGRSPDAHHTPQ